MIQISFGRTVCFLRAVSCSFKYLRPDIQDYSYICNFFIRSFFICWPVLFAMSGKKHLYYIFSHKRAIFIINSWSKVSNYKMVFLSFKVNLTAILITYFLLHYKVFFLNKFLLLACLFISINPYIK